MSAPVFRDAGHALHASYLILSLPARTRSPTAILIDALAKRSHVWDEAPAPSAARVDFGGLSPLEVRAQCALVAAVVEHLPHPAERDACKAIYAQQAAKAEGVRGLARYLEPLLAQGGEYPLYACWHVFARTHQRPGITQGDVAERFGVPLRQVDHDCRRIRKSAHALHARALGALQERFERDGLVHSSATL